MRPLVHSVRISKARTSCASLRRRQRPPLPSLAHCPPCPRPPRLRCPRWNKGAAPPPKTRRERDHIDAVVAYCTGCANRPERARQLPPVAPDAPRVLHVPSHIFTRVSARQDSAAPSDDGDDEPLLADADDWALPRFQAALERFPESANLHNELGFTHRKLRPFDKSE